MTHHIRETCHLSFENNLPTIWYEDNIYNMHNSNQIRVYKRRYEIEQNISHQNFSTCITLKKMTISVFNKNFFRRQLRKLIYKDITHNTFEKLVHTIGMRRLRELKWCNHEESKNIVHFFPWLWFFSLDFLIKVFNEATIKVYKRLHSFYLIIVFPTDFFHRKYLTRQLFYIIWISK